MFLNKIAIKQNQNLSHASEKKTITLVTLIFDQRYRRFRIYDYNLHFLKSQNSLIWFNNNRFVKNDRCEFLEISIKQQHAPKNTWPQVIMLGLYVLIFTVIRFIITFINSLKKNSNWKPHKALYTLNYRTTRIVKKKVLGFFRVISYSHLSNNPNSLVFNYIWRLQERFSKQNKSSLKAEHIFRNVTSWNLFINACG